MSGKWFVSKDMVGKIGSPKVAGPFSSRDDAFAAREAMERMYGNYSVFEEPELPHVDLPTEPTLGWLDWRVESANNSGRDLDFWCGPGPERGCAMRGAEKHIDAETYLYPPSFTAFTPATAVPTDALGELRATHKEARFGDLIPRGTVSRFLRAVDKANA